MSGIISEAADALETVAEKIASIDLSQEQAQVAGTLSAAAATLGEIQASLRGFVEQVGEPQSVPQAATVDNPQEPPEGNVETLPEPGAELPEGATVIENEPGAE